MSTVKYIPKASKSLAKAIEYALKNVPDGAPSHFEGLPPDGNAAYKVMSSVQKLHNYQGKQKYRTLIHSFSKEDMKNLSRDEMMDLSVKLAKKSFPNYQFVAGMHLDTDHIHTHIVFNISHPDRKRNIIRNKLDQNRIRNINDKIMKEKGRPLPAKGNTTKERGEYSLATQRIKMGNIPYVRDLKQKMDYARSLATDFHEYSAYLGTFNVGIRIEKKNISYLYPSKQKAIRAKFLGDEYGKKDLASQFNLNHQKYAKDPILKEVTGKKLEGTFGVQKAYDRRLKELESFVSKNRREERYMSPSTKNLLALGVSKRDIDRVNRGSLLGYIKKNNIKTMENSNGEIVLAKREHIVIRDSAWINTKNKTQGNLIDFMAIHKNISYLDALSRMSSNLRLSLLAKEHRSQKLTYRSFFVPKDKQMTLKKAAREINDLFFKLGVNKRYTDDLLKRNQVHVSKTGVIHLFGRDDLNGAFLFEKDEQGQWNKKAVGQSQKPFFKLSKNSKEGVVFLDPFSFMKSSSMGIGSFERKSTSILALMESKEEEIDKFVAENRNLSKLTFYTPKGKSLDPTSLSFINKLQKRYRLFGVEISLTNDLSRVQSRSRSLDR